jgi:pyruvate ferredoxin oxidoreductase beta subunit/2-oxoisovalerate ferredoxin oxidoreductase beta subunit
VSEKLLDGMAQSKRDRSEPLLRPGNTNCGGCGMSVALNLLTHAVADVPVQMVIPACCAIVAAGPYPHSNYGAPVFASTFASAAAVATGLARVAQINRERTRVIAFAGDGGTYDIGMATLSAAAERDEDILFVCYDNEIYGNTGGQRSSATPVGAKTTTTPGGKAHGKKDILGILAAHGVPFACSVSIAHPEDAVRKMWQAVHCQGFRFVHVLSPCPTGWKSEPADGVELVRLAVDSGLYPVLSIRDGQQFTVDVEPSFDRAALDAYFGRQGRFKGTDLDVGAVEQAIQRHWVGIRARA